MKCLSKIFSVLLALILVCVAAAAAYAQEVPEQNRTGTITVKMESDGKAVTGGTLTAYRVGEIREDDGNYNFVAVSGLESFIVNNDMDFAGVFSEEALRSPELMSALAKFVTKESFPAYAVEKNENGRVVFGNVTLGLYLIVQTKASDGYKPISAFLISLPMNEGGTYVYNVNAEGKFEIENAPAKPDKPTEPGRPTTPDKPSESKLPQTGQLNWPVPVMAALGLCLLMLGMALRTGRKGETL